MARVRDEVRMGLQTAALELFRTLGYDRTTAAQIAARAGVTERTFFRHFADKREVLFDGAARLQAALTQSVAEAPEGLGALDTLFRAFQSVQAPLEDNRTFSKPRQEVISATPALRERELAKLDTLAGALAAALRARGVPELRAELAARAGMSGFVQAVVAWLDDSKVGLSERLDSAARELRALLAEDGRQKSGLGPERPGARRVSKRPASI